MRLSSRGFSSSHVNACSLSRSLMSSENSSWLRARRRFPTTRRDRRCRHHRHHAHHRCNTDAAPAGLDRQLAQTPCCLRKAFALRRETPVGAVGLGSGECGSQQTAPCRGLRSCAADSRWEPLSITATEQTVGTLECTYMMVPIGCARP